MQQYNFEIANSQRNIGNSRNRASDILVVENDDLNQSVFNIVLRRTYGVTIANNAEEAREQLNKRKYDIILMDISLGAGETGLELTEELKQDTKYKDIPIIVVTAHVFKEDKIMAMNAGADEYITKPYEIRELLKKIEKQLERKRPGENRIH